ncbi:allantoinase AllB [Rothia sp. BD8]|uniref:allantoinase AllB n=1 Tax=Rothia sp. BD8 TaxID=2953894 RepID=UPI003844534C
MIRSLTARRILWDGDWAEGTLEIAEDGRVAGFRAHDVTHLAQAALQDGHLRLAGHQEACPAVVDSHVHLNEPGRTEWEGFATGTRAAALGGVGTVVDMPLNSVPPTTTVPALASKRAAARGQLHVDTAYWGGAVPENLDSLVPLHRAGVTGFKCFTLDSGVPEFPPLDPQQLHRAAQRLAEQDALLIVHCEDAPTLGTAPHGPTSSYLEFERSRPEQAEAAAVRQVLDVVRRTGGRAHILHVSSAAGVEEIRAGKTEGLPVTAETCPHYLRFLAEEIPDGAAEFKCCPPIRGAHAQDALWQALIDGTLDLVVSDHSPATAEEKFASGGELQQAWGGIAGLQTSWIATAEKARERGIGTEEVSRWMARNPARLVGLGDRKGTLATGFDADVLVYDPEQTTEVLGPGLAYKNPISAYAGLRIRGAVLGTLSRGNPVHGDWLGADPELPRGQEILMDLP